MFKSLAAQQATHGLSDITTPDRNPRQLLLRAMLDPEVPAGPGAIARVIWTRDHTRMW